MTFEQIMDLPVNELAMPQSHLYLWIPNALLQEGLEVMRRWGFTYKTNIVWYKIRKRMEVPMAAESAFTSAT